MTDEAYMRMAIELAEKGRGWVNPNPLVGAVIVKEGHIIGRGYHKKCGMPHAEREALADCMESAQGATLYVTLEPCCHYGKTPPCTEAIIKAGIRKVVIGAKDPNPLVSGKGIATLRESGILVEEGILKQACEEQNRIFFHYMKTGTPYVILKYAMTADGKIATVTGASHWITGELARKRVHVTRHETMGIMVGSQTVSCDDPHLNARIENGRNPVRIVCDTTLRTSKNAYVVRTARDQRTIIVTGDRKEDNWIEYQKCGCEVLLVPTKDERIDLKHLMGQLGEMGIDSILLEGGATLNWSALAEGIVDEVQMYIAPKLVGGEMAKTPVAGMGVNKLEDAFEIEWKEIQKVGEDVLLTARIKRRNT